MVTTLQVFFFSSSSFLGYKSLAVMPHLCFDLMLLGLIRGVGLYKISLYFTAAQHSHQVFLLLKSLLEFKEHV